MKTTTKYELIENEIELDKRLLKSGFEYHPWMTFEDDRDQYPHTLGLFDNLDEALEELKKHKSHIRIAGHYILVTEFYIEDGEYNEDGEFEWGSNGIEIAPLDEHSQDLIKYI